MDEWGEDVLAELAPQLVAFVAVAQAGHVTHAAHSLDMPQSSVSRRLRSLERTLGVALFIPQGRQVVLTAAGRNLLARLQSPMRALTEALASATADADAETGLVHCGFPLSIGPLTVPDILAGFHDHAPGIRLNLRQAHGAELTRALHAGELDLAVIIPEPAGLPTERLGEQPLQLHIARTHRFAARPHVDLAELADEIFIANPSSYNLRHMLDTWCTNAGFAPASEWKSPSSTPSATSSHTTSASRYSHPPKHSTQTLSPYPSPDPTPTPAPSP